MKSKSGKILDEFYIQALLLAKVVERILRKKAALKMTLKKELVLKPVTEFKRRMRVTSYEKFNRVTYISTVNFYASEENLGKDNTLGLIVLYIEEDYIVNLLRRLGYPVTNLNDQELIEDAAGTFCNLIAGNFKAGLMQLGYSDLSMSHFSSYRNEVLNGVAYYTKQQQIYEVSMLINGEKRIVMDLNMGPVPKLDKSMFSH